MGYTHTHTGTGRGLLLTLLSSSDDGQNEERERVVRLFSLCLGLPRVSCDKMPILFSYLIFLHQLKGEFFDLSPISGSVRSPLLGAHSLTLTSFFSLSGGGVKYRFRSQQDLSPIIPHTVQTPDSPPLGQEWGRSGTMSRISLRTDIKIFGDCTVQK